MVVIEIHGDVTHGLWSPQRGESRWAQNIAAVLGMAGETVFCTGSWHPFEDPWGVCPPVPNVHFVPWPAFAGREYDVFFDTAHWHGKPVIGRPRRVLRGYFSYDSSVIDAEWPEGHRLVYPYAHQAASMALAPRESRLLQCPFLGWDFWRGIGGGMSPPRERTGLLWMTKQPFGVWGPDHSTARWADILLRLTEELARTRGMRPMFVQDHELQQGAGADYRAFDRARAIDGAELYGALPLGIAQRCMRESVLAIGLPHGLGFPLEAAAEGCCPLVWRSLLPGMVGAVEAVAPEVVLDPMTPDEKRAREVVYALLDDAELRGRVIEAVAGRVREEFSAEAALACWREVRRWIS